MRIAAHISLARKPPKFLVNPAPVSRATPCLAPGPDRVLSLISWRVQPSPGSPPLSHTFPKASPYPRPMQPPAQVAKAFGQTVRMYRLKRGMTQEELAERCGLDLSYVGGIERGQRNPTLGVIHALAAVLGVEMADLLKG